MQQYIKKRFNMKNLNVKYLLGNNERFDYFILATKHEIKLNVNTLAFKLDSSDKANVIEYPGINGNFDYLLEQRDKSGNFKGYILCNEDDTI